MNSNTREILLHKMIDDKELEALIDAWTAYYDDPTGPNRDKHRWASYEVMSWAETNPELLWLFISSAYKRDLSDKVLGNLAAGPLEDLIEHSGAEYKDRIEDLAIKDERFNDLIEQCLAES
jgi:hypothetical protein